MIVWKTDLVAGARKFPVDMASITINIGFWTDAGCPKLRPGPVLGQIETIFMQDLHITLLDVEPKADNATKVNLI